MMFFIYLIIFLLTISIIIKILILDTSKEIKRLKEELEKKNQIIDKLIKEKQVLQEVYEGLKAEYEELESHLYKEKIQ